jgi:hypothetical protein
MTNLKDICFIILSYLSLCISCKKERSCDGCINGNRHPIASAGPDQVITLPTNTVLLDGKLSSDPEGKISSWRWTKISVLLLLLSSGHLIR